VSETQPSAVALRIAVGLVGLLLVGVVVVSQILDDGQTTEETNAAPTTSVTQPPRTGPLPLVAVDAPDAGSAECTRLAGALPDQLPRSGTTLRRLPLAEPAPKAAAAWGTDRGEPLVLRCGLARPAELTRTASLLGIDEVQWLAVDGDGARTWYVVDRAVYIALTVPEDIGTGPLQEISATVAENLSAAPIRPN
jgi:hypothetical protein